MGLPVLWLSAATLIASASDFAISASEAVRSALCAGDTSNTSGNRILAFNVDSEFAVQGENLQCCTYYLFHIPTW